MDVLYTKVSGPEGTCTTPLGMKDRTIRVKVSGAELDLPLEEAKRLAWEILKELDTYEQSRRAPGGACLRCGDYTTTTFCSRKCANR